MPLVIQYVYTTNAISGVAGKIHWHSANRCGLFSDGGGKYLDLKWIAVNGLRLFECLPEGNYWSDKDSFRFYRKISGLWSGAEGIKTSIRKVLFVVLRISRTLHLHLHIVLICLFSLYSLFITLLISRRRSLF